MKAEYVAVEDICETPQTIRFEAGFSYTTLRGPDGMWYEIAPGIVLELAASQVREYDAEKTSEKEGG